MFPSDRHRPETSLLTLFRHDARHRSICSSAPTVNAHITQLDPAAASENYPEFDEDGARGYRRRHLMTGPVAAARDSGTFVLSGGEPGFFGLDAHEDQG